MPYYSKLYFVVGDEGYHGDGKNTISLEILQGEGNRRWLEPHYFDDRLKPIGEIKTMTPEGPDDPNSLIDACIAFAPKYFEGCPSLEEIKQSMKSFKHLDFDLDKEKIPQLWGKLRDEAKPIFKKLKIFKPSLAELDEK